MKHAFFTLLILSAATVACGTYPSAPAATPVTTTGSTAEHSHPTGGHDEKHGDLSPALQAFHGALSPVWHTDPGPGRVEKTCTSTKAMQEKAVAIGDAELSAAVNALDPACAKEGRSEVEAKLSSVHDRFHVVAKIAKHEHH